MTKFSNGFYSHSDSYLKSMNKKDLIVHIRTIEKNWQNALITNEIQYNNCKKLLAEERNKAIDEFAETLKEKYEEHNFDLCLRQNDYYSYSNSCMLFESYIDEIAEQLKAGA